LFTPYIVEQAFVTRPSQLIDIFPTILDYAGLDAEVRSQPLFLRV